MLEYRDELQHDKLIYNRSLTKQERNRIDYYKRQLKSGVAPEVVAKRASKALKNAQFRSNVLDRVRGFMIV